MVCVCVDCGVYVGCGVVCLCGVCVGCGVVCLCGVCAGFYVWLWNGLSCFVIRPKRYFFLTFFLICIFCVNSLEPVWCGSGEGISKRGRYIISVLEWNTVPINSSSPFNHLNHYMSLADS